MGHEPEAEIEATGFDLGFHVARREFLHPDGDARVFLRQPSQHRVRNGSPPSAVESPSRFTRPPTSPGYVGNRVARVVEFAQHDFGALAKRGARFREKYAFADAPGATMCAAFALAG